MQWRYFVIHADHHRVEPIGIFAVNEGVPLYNVSFDHVDRRWVYDPGVVDYVLFDRADEAEEVDRERAEAMARSLGLVPLPDEDELRRIVERSTTGWESVDLDWPERGTTG